MAPRRAPPGRKSAAPGPPDEAIVAAQEQLLLQAVVAYRDGDVVTADDLCRRLVQQAPHFAPAHMLLGMVAGKRGDPAAGVTALREAVAVDPDYLEARMELAGLLSASGQAAAAIAACEEALARWPDSAGLYNVLGLALLVDRQIPEAIATLQRAAAIDPDLPIIHHNLGLAFQAASRDDEAVAAYRRAIAAAPQNADSYVQLAHLLFAHGRRDEAREVLRRGSLAQPNSAGARLMRAELLLGEDRLAEAEALVRQIVQTDAASAPAHHLLAIVHQQAGRFAEARESYERTLVLSPQRTSALIGLVMSRKIVPADQPLVERLLGLLDDARLPEVSRTDVHYALGKAYDDVGDYHSATRHFDAANAIVADRIDRAGMTFDPVGHRANIDHMIAGFSGAFLTERRSTALASDLPVLIVGMPRSGTTLVEQIVSSHPDIGAGGEQHFWPAHAALVGPVMADQVPPEELRRGAEAYCSLLRGLAPAARHVTDKMPANFLLLGLIHLALPNARIIHCRRNAVDTCLSVYSTPFANLVNFAHRRDDIVAYYREYVRLMSHWRRVIPTDRLLEIDYEVLVADRESVARRIIAFCGLPWSDACLHHEANPHAIHTPAWWQARQPVYRTSIDRWRNYEPWLGVFSQLLDPATAAVDYTSSRKE